MSRKKAGISSAVFRARYLDRSREIYRRTIESKPWIKQMHSTFLGLTPGMKIVDVGCGTGDFTRYLASLVPGKCTIIGVDASAANIQSAEKQTKKEGLSTRVSFRTGDVYDIPVEDRWADLVCCRCLLMHLTDPVKAVREMSRVAQQNGTVAAFERGRLQSAYVPDDDKLTKQIASLSESYVEGVRKLEGKHFDIGNRLPMIFQRAGLHEIRAEVEAHPFLTSDPRRSLEETRDELGFYLATFRAAKKQSVRAMLAGGASKAKVDEYNHWLEKWMNGFLDGSRKLRIDAVFTTAGVGVFNTGGLILVAGRKPVDSG